MKVFLDLDGVIVDFMGGLLERFPCPHLQFKKGSYDTIKQIAAYHGIQERDIWFHLDPNFWIDLKFTNEAKELITFLEEEFGISNICLCSSPANERGAHGKMLWIKENLPEYWRLRHYMFTSVKYFCASEDSLLIDDSDEQIYDFELYDGKAILVPRFWNKGHAFEGDVVEYVKSKSKLIV